jgi:hypothetical protein
MNKPKEITRAEEYVAGGFIRVPNPCGNCAEPFKSPPCRTTSCDVPVSRKGYPRRQANAIRRASPLESMRDYL